jgi:hypothetical protein
VKGHQNDITTELDLTSVDDFVKYWKDASDLTQHFIFYKSGGSEGSAFPFATERSLKKEGKHDDHKQTVEEQYPDEPGEENDAMLNRRDPNYDVCVYFHDANSCNLWEKKTDKQWKHKGYIIAPESESDDSGSDSDDDDGDDDDDDTDDNADDKNSVSESKSGTESESESDSESESEATDSSDTEREDNNTTDEEKEKKVENVETMNEQKGESDLKSGSKRKRSGSASASSAKKSKLT